MKRMAQMWVVISAVLFAQYGFSAEVNSNDDVVAKNKEVKVYFDVNIGESEKLATRLQLIDKTYGDLIAAGLTPRVIVGIRGKASNFFTKDDDYILETDIPIKKKISARVVQFKSAGFRLEQCSIAAAMQGITEADFLPQLEIVNNGYVSMIGYQHQGYAYVPMD